MKSKYVIAIQPKAIMYLIDFCNHVSGNGFPETADKLFTEYVGKCFELETFPFRYELCKYKYKNYHCFSYKSLVFVYRVIAKTVEIINVLHAKTYN